MAYSVDQWNELFVAAAGAGAALAGLVFVAVSINIDRILKLVGVPERALQTVCMLLGVVVVSFFGLAPQSSAAFGLEILAVGLVLIFLFARTLPVTTREAGPGRSSAVSRVVLLTLGSVPYAVGGLSLLAGAGGGLYWVLAGMVAATAGAVANAWVLLVEILR